jgi:hypothetical protein
MQLRLAPLLPRALVPQPVAERLKYDQREPDLLRLPHSAASFDPCRVEKVMHQARQIEDHRHPVVRVAWIEFGAEHLACDPPVRGEGVEPLLDHAGEPLIGSEALQLVSRHLEHGQTGALEPGIGDRVDVPEPLPYRGKRHTGTLGYT